MDRFIVISGCSGGGKSTLLAELERRDHSVVEEPGRRIVAEERQGEGRALPWINLSAFAERAIGMALQDRKQALAMPGMVFFDRGLIDAAAALEHATGQQKVRDYAAHRYHRTVFMTPPWPEIYESDHDRQHDLDSAIEEYQRLLNAYASLDYSLEILPLAPVTDRADFVLRHLAQARRR